MKSLTHQNHNIPPVWDENSEILILGSFPSVKSREAQFFYGHPQNRFWRVLAKVFDSDTPQTIQEKTTFLLKNKIAVWDVIASCDISGSSDSSIKNAVPNDVKKLISSSKINHIFLNGGTAARLYKKYMSDKIKIPATNMPSTSPANAAWTFEKLSEKWKLLFLK